MRTSILIALVACSSFVLGLAVAGRAPREAAAAETRAEAAVEGLDWKSDGKTLTLTSTAPGTAFLVLGRLRAGASAAGIPKRPAKQVRLSVSTVSGLTLYRVSPVLACQGNSCRPCHPGERSSENCPVPPPIPIGAGRFEVGLGG